MLTCDDAAGRLYDEDSRRSLATGGAAPPDVAPHLESCPACQQMWRDGAGDVQGLRLLREEQNPPVELNRRLRDAMARRLQPPSQLAAVASALLTGALGLPIALAVLPELPEAFRAIGPILWATIGAAVAFAAGAAHEALLRLR